VLVRAADIRRDDLQNRAVLDRFALWILHFGIINGLNLNLAWSKEDNSAIARHGKLLLVWGDV